MTIQIFTKKLYTMVLPNFSYKIFTFLELMIEYCFTCLFHIPILKSFPHYITSVRCLSVLISRWSKYQVIWSFGDFFFYSLPSSCPILGSQCSLLFVLYYFPGFMSSCLLISPIGLIQYTSSSFLRKSSMEKNIWLLVFWKMSILCLLFIGGLAGHRSQVRNNFHAIF